MLVRIEKWRIALTEFVRSTKRGKKCNRCGESDIRCLDYHHPNPKDKFKSVSRMVQEAFSRELIMKEINKCELICANCHRKETFDFT